MSDKNVRERGVTSYLEETDYEDRPIGEEEWINQASFSRMMPFTDHQGYEIISDECPRFKRYGNCYHKKQTSSVGHSDVYWSYLSNEFHITNSAYFINDMSAEHYTHPSAGPLIAEACIGMKPQLGGDLSLTNFLLELRDLKMMFRLFSRTRSLIGNLAAGHLNIQFGWKPFIRETQILWEKLSNVEKALRDYKSRCGIVQVRHWKKVLESNTTNTYNSDALPNHARKVCSRVDAVFHAAMRYTYTIPEINSQHAKLKGVLDLLGLKANLSVIWEAIPFSFAVDWFISVDDFLRQFDTNYLEAQVTILDFCYSIKSTELADFYVWPRPAEGGHYTQTASVETTVYNRRRTLPSNELYGLELVDGFGGRQVGLAAALLLA